MQYKNFDINTIIFEVLIALEPLKNRRSNCDLLFFYKLFNKMIDAPNIIEEFKFCIPTKNTRLQYIYINIPTILL